MNQGKIGKENQKYRITNITDMNDKFIMSGQDFNQYLQTIDVTCVDMCHELYGLPNIEEVISGFEKELFNMVNK